MIQLLFFLLLPALLSGMCQHGSCLNPNAPRIAGGDPSSRNSRPFQVALYTEVSETETTGFCGGSLIHQEWVLTAAHCCFLNGQEVDNIQAIIGAHSLYDRYENGRRISRVITIEVHPEYDEFYFSNDVALLRLANVMQITDVVDTIRLPYLHMLNDNFAGMTATVSGWGIPADGVTFVSPTLREKLMPVVSDSYCNQTYMFQLRGSVVCGFSTQSGTCKGDNGGPMTIFYNSTEEHILIGVASFVSAGGCNIELPSVFTRVQPYLDWISNVTGIGLYP